MNTPKPSSQNLGEWNVYVTEGKTKDDRKARLLQAPEKHQSNIKSHVELVFKLRNGK